MNRTDKFIDKQIVLKLGNKKKMNELVAIIKYERKDEEGNLKGNMIELADTHVLISKLGGNIPRDQKYAI